MTKYKIILLFTLYTTLYSEFVLSQNFKISIPGASFNSFDGGRTTHFNGCFINRLDQNSIMDGDMYAGLDVPGGAIITGVTAHFFDAAYAKNNRPKLMLRVRNNFSDIDELAIAENSNMPYVFGYSQETVTIQPTYVTQQDDFFDLIFIAGDSNIINAYYICGVDVHYQLPE